MLSKISDWIVESVSKLSCEQKFCCSFQSFQNCCSCMYQLIILDIISIFGHSALNLSSLYRLSTQKEYLTVSLNGDFNWFLKIEKVFQYSGIFESILPRYAVNNQIMIQLFMHRHKLKSISILFQLNYWISAS